MNHAQPVRAEPVRAERDPNRDRRPSGLPGPLPLRRPSLPALAAALAAGVFLLHSIYLNCVVDDAFIVLRYSRHLAEGHGLTWNIGERPLEGYTDFLWVVLGALGFKLELNAPLLFQVLGILSGLGTVVVAVLLASRVVGHESSAAWIPGLLLAFSGPFATWASSGLETNLFGFFLLLGLYHVLRYHRGRSHPRLALGCLALFLATLTRPEGLMVAVLALGFLALIEAGRPGALAALARIAALGYLAPLAAYLGWKLLYFGELLPNTYYAKTGGEALQYLRGARYLGYFTRDFLLPLAPVSILLLGWRPLARKGRVGGTPRRGGPSRAIAALRAHPEIGLLAVVCLVYTSYIVYVGGDYMPMYRFFVPLLPLITILVASAFAAAYREAAGRPGRRAVLAGCLAAAALLPLYHSTPFERDSFGQSPIMEGTFRGVQKQRHNTARLSLIGKFFDRYRGSKDESLATRGIGAIAYYSNLQVHDVLGIVDATIARRRPARLGRGLPGHEKQDLLYTLSKHPTYLVLTSTLTPEPMTFDELTRWMTPEVKEVVGRDYRIASVWLDDRENREEGNLSFFERTTRPARALR